MFKPGQLTRVRGTGNGDIAIEVGDGVGAFSLSAANILFTAGTGSASLTAYLVPFGGALTQLPMFTLGGVGAGGDDVFLRIGDEELRHWYFHADANMRQDILRLEWTDPGTSTWEYHIDLMVW